MAPAGADFGACVFGVSCTTVDMPSLPELHWRASPRGTSKLCRNGCCIATGRALRRTANRCAQLLFLHASSFASVGAYGELPFWGRGVSAESGRFLWSKV